MTSAMIKGSSTKLRRVGREIAGKRGLVFTEKARDITYDWHRHGQHQLIYSMSGRIVLESRRARWFLPPLRAAWIPAGLLHRTQLQRAEIISICFQRSSLAWTLEDIRVINVTPLLKEMLFYARPWTQPSASGPRNSKLQQAFLELLGQLCRDWLGEELPFWLPTSNDPAIGRVLAYLEKDLASARLDLAARHGGLSARSLRRRFFASTGWSWQQYLYHSRMLLAVDGLLSTHKSILEIALECGYESPSAFARAFAKFSGITPLDFRLKKSR
jgi:AraC-like DNA-binding protein